MQNNAIEYADLIDVMNIIYLFSAGKILAFFNLDSPNSTKFWID